MSHMTRQQRRYLARHPEPQRRGYGDLQCSACGLRLCPDCGGHLCPDCGGHIRYGQESPSAASDTGR